MFKRIIVISGPVGAGKSTLATALTEFGLRVVKTRELVKGAAALGINVENLGLGTSEREEYVRGEKNLVVDLGRRLSAADEERRFQRTMKRTSNRMRGDYATSPQHLRGLALVQWRRLFDVSNAHRILCTRPVQGWSARPLKGRRTSSARTEEAAGAW
jgi:hypothetical protein